MDIEGAEKDVLLFLIKISSFIRTEFIYMILNNL